MGDNGGPSNSKLPFNDGDFKAGGGGDNSGLSDGGLDSTPNKMGDQVNHTDADNSAGADHYGKYYDGPNWDKSDSDFGSYGPDEVYDPTTGTYLILMAQILLL